MASACKRHEVDFLFALLFPFRVCFTKLARHDIISGAMQQPLMSSADSQLHRVAFLVMIRYRRWCTAHELYDGIGAEMQVVRLLQVEHAGQRYYLPDRMVMSRQADSQMTAGGMPHHYHPLAVDVLFGALLHEKAIGFVDVFKGSRPATAYVA